MELKDFIPMLECVLKYADKHIDAVMLSDTNPNEVVVYFDTDYYIAVDVENYDLVEVLGYVALTIWEHRE